jgi:hypothetical protein
VVSGSKICTGSALKSPVRHAAGGTVTSRGWVSRLSR